MKILIGMHHPKQFWIFKNLILIGKSRNWKFNVLISQKDILEDLLKLESIDYTIIGQNQPNISKKILELQKLIIKTLKITKKNKPDLLLGQAFPHFAYISALHNNPYIIFEDTEHVKWLHKITLPFSSKIITPYFFKKDLGKKHIKVDTFFELAYLHHNYFKPNPNIIRDMDISKDERYIIIRFVSWGASHDVGQLGLSDSEKLELVKEIEKFGVPIITSEGPLPEKLKKYQITIPPHRIHDALYYSNMYVGEGGTMASEAALMGVPNVLINPLAKNCGNFEELANKYKIHSYFDNLKSAKKVIHNLLSDETSKTIWQKRLVKLMNDKIDFTKYMLEMVENIKNNKSTDHLA